MAQTEPVVPLARGLRAPRAAGVAGLLFSALFLASILLLRHHPRSGAGAAELRAFYVEGNGKYVNLVGLYLAPFAGIASIWFLAVARSHVGHRTDRFFDTVFLGSGVLFGRDDVHRRSGGGCVLRRRSDSRTQALRSRGRWISRVLLPTHCCIRSRSKSPECS